MTSGEATSADPPGDDTDVSVKDAAWLARVSETTMQRWRRSNGATNVDTPLTWRALREMCAARRHALLDITWLTITPADPLPTQWRPSGQNRGSSESNPQEAPPTPNAHADPAGGHLTAPPPSPPAHTSTSSPPAIARITELETALAEAHAQIENLDVAAMSYRDSWRRTRDQTRRF